MTDTDNGALPRNIILAGFMGTGKSTVGRILARCLGWKFADTDHMIEKNAGRRISEIFDEDGEWAFRNMESEVAREMGSLKDHIISTGGGFMLRPENRIAARNAGAVVLLEASPEAIYDRVRNSTHRPLLQADDPQERIRQMLEKRNATYSLLPFQVPTDGLSPQAVAQKVLDQLGYDAKHPSLET